MVMTNDHATFKCIVLIHRMRQKHFNTYTYNVTRVKYTYIITINVVIY